MPVSQNANRNLTFLPRISWLWTWWKIPGRYLSEQGGVIRLTIPIKENHSQYVNGPRKAKALVKRAMIATSDSHWACNQRSRQGWLWHLWPEKFLEKQMWQEGCLHQGQGDRKSQHSRRATWIWRHTSSLCKGQLETPCRWWWCWHLGVHPGKREVPKSRLVHHWLQSPRVHLWW